jgi:hypothetical protein
VLFAAGAASMSVPFILAIALLALGHPQGPPRPSFELAANVVLIVWTLGALPSGILLVRDAVRRRRQLRRDSEAWDFTGFSVLPVSRLFVAPIDRRGRPARIASAAARPEAFLAVPVNDARSPAGTPLMQRALSRDELDEVALHARMPVWRWRLLFPISLFTVWIAAARLAGAPLPGAVGALGLFGIAWISWRKARVRVALRRDGAAAVAVIVPASAEQPELEFLRSSGTEWTVGGAPSAWRLAPVSSDRPR